MEKFMSLLYNVDDHIRWSESAVKTMRPDLKLEYKRLVKLHPDIPELVYPYINMSDVLAAYFMLCDYFSDPSSDNAEGSMLIGLRDGNLLASALGRQATSFGVRMKYSSPIEICSTLFYGLVKNHAFSDGNKRTALLTLLYHLDRYRYMPKVRDVEFEALVVAVAANKLSEAYPYVWEKCVGNDQEVRTIARLLRKMTVKKDNSYHMDMTAADFSAALRNIGLECEQEGISLKIVQKSKATIFRKQEIVRTFKIPFRGWTRTIGPGTARKVLSHFEIYEQHSSYQSFIEDRDARYILINRFETPLRRLKDR